MLCQQIKFKNDVYGNPRSIVVCYKNYGSSRRLYPAKVINLGYKCIEQVITEDDEILPAIYTYDSYSKTLREVKALCN